MTHHPDQASLRSLQPVYPSIPRGAILALIGTAVLGAILLAIGRGWYPNWDRRWLLGYLVAFAFVLSLSLGSLFFVLLQHLMRAGWSVLVRRPAEIFSLNLWTVALLFVPLGWAVWHGQLYPWAAAPSSKPVSPAEHGPPAAVFTETTAGHAQGTGHAAIAGHAAGADHGPATSEVAAPDLYVHQTLDALTLSKAGWLNRPAYLLRVAGYFLVWIVIAGWYFGRSRELDVAPTGTAPTRHMEWTAGLAAIAFGLTLTFASFDLLMSLDPHWYSTMFGVYFFAGCALGGISFNLLTLLLLTEWELFPRLLSAEHRRDLGRLVFAFVFFWGYIAFSQYMLLWYANIPETTRWFAVRGASQASGFGNSWGWLLLVLLFGHLLIPFAGIMSRHVKGSRRAMLFWTSWLLVMHYCDLYWLVMPELGPQLTFGPLELGSLLLVGSLYLLGASFFATRTSLLAVGDPRMNESLRITEVY